MESGIDGYSRSSAREIARLEDYYRNHYDESRRLEVGGSADVEHARTLDILQRYLPSPPSVVLDIGGGTGAYAFSLARAGYQVHLVDRVAYHIEQARASSAAVPLASCLVGDARKLEFSDWSPDAVLLLGPPTTLRTVPSTSAACVRYTECCGPAGLCSRLRFLASPV